MPTPTTKTALELEQIEDLEANLDGYTKIPAVHTIPAHFAQMGKTEAANMFSRVLHLAQNLRARGVNIDHRVYYSGDDIQNFLLGDFSYTTANLVQTLEALEAILPQYLTPEESFSPELNATLFWGESQYERDYFLQKDRLSLHGGMTEVGVQERLMRSIIKRTSERFVTEETVLATHLDSIIEASRLAQAELGITHDLKITPAIIEAMSQLQTDDFDGSKMILSIETEGAPRLVIAGIPQVLNCYHATLEDTTLYSTACWGEFVAHPEDFLKRALSEAGFESQKDHPTCSLLYQWYLDLARIQLMFGNIAYRFPYEGKEVAAAEIFAAMQQIPLDARGDIGAYVSVCQAKLNDIGSPERSSRNHKQQAIMLLSQKTETENPEAHLVQLYQQAIDKNIEDGGMALMYAEDEKQSIAARRQKFFFEGKDQDADIIVPPHTRRIIERQAKGNSERISELITLIHDINRRYGIEVTVKYCGNAENTQRIIEKRRLPKSAILLRTFGTITEAIATLQNAFDALMFYDQEGTENPFSGQSIEIQWYDEHNPDELKYDSCHKKSNTCDTDKSLVHHQCGHILDMLEGKHWEQTWFDRDYDRALGKKRAIDSIIAASQKMTLLEFQRKDESIILDIRRQWLGKELQYRFLGEDQTIIVSQYVNHDGSFKGSPTQFSLTNGIEERAELWMMFATSPMELGDMDIECQTRLVAMAKALVDQGVLGKKWFVTKSGHFADLI